LQLQQLMVRLSIISFFFSSFAFFFLNLKSCSSIKTKCLVDIWEPQIDETAFTPHFQALPCNVEYVEQEDDFDVVSIVQVDSTRKHEDKDKEETH
jgi:hypothetical protein